jgi:acetyl-CoA/propionyl-CoA carboxylase biotin carboxyl carrier protein
MKKVLIANRGEIAVRIVRACRDHGLRSVAVYADDDLDALHVRMADEAHALHGQRPADTYLDIGKLIAVAQTSGADAVHPGYGFLSENAAFAQAVIDAGLTWIGPPPAAMALLGDKLSARAMALRVGAPLAAGTTEPVRDVAEIHAFARQHGLPMAIKAAYGGGGRGLKVVWRWTRSTSCCLRRARGPGRVRPRRMLRRAVLDQPRHIEAQVLADAHGNVRVLGTRDCSLQRRNQKLVEEAPRPSSATQRARIHQAAVDICRAAGYVSAGTVEFLLSQSGAISFLEVNTRLQVEHPVTEETTGFDLVREQFRVAEGARLDAGDVPAPHGHAFEFRINAEDVGRGFLPAPGRITRFDTPGGGRARGQRRGRRLFGGRPIRLPAGQADRVGPHAPGRHRARAAPLAEFTIEGVPTVLPFHRAVMQHADFTSDDKLAVHTRWIETDLARRGRPSPLPGPSRPPPMD